jgi:uncharacterized protein YqgV (UPF0045/DUF77 family)
MGEPAVSMADVLDAVKQIRNLPVRRGTSNRVGALIDSVIEYAEKGNTKELLKAVHSLHEITEDDKVYDLTTVIVRHVEQGKR